MDMTGDKETYMAEANTRGAGVATVEAANTIRSTATAPAEDEASQIHRQQSHPLTQVPGFTQS